jgi:hypothetical protein
MPWPDHRTALHEALLAEYGEPLTPCTAAGLPTGDVRTGVLYRRGDAVAASWPGQSPGWQPGDQMQPYATLLAADTTEIDTQGHLVTPDGALYRITRMHPPDDGLVRLDLAEAA